MSETIGILHPGAMGISVAAAARHNGHIVYWVSPGRSVATQARAKQHGLMDARTLEALCATCSIVISVCPPHAAADVAEQVVAASFRGLYVDANAIAPQRAHQIGALLAANSVSFVDGGIIGGPAWQPNTTWLYLSGEEAERVAACFTNSPLETEVIGTEIGKASALKMCYAAYTKGTTALLCGILAAANQLGVQQELLDEWARDGSGFAEQTVNRVRRVTAKAWRFAGEMDEIAATFEAVGLPGGFHDAAAILYRRLAPFKDQTGIPPLVEVLGALT